MTEEQLKEQMIAQMAALTNKKQNLRYFNKHGLTFNDYSIVQDLNNDFHKAGINLWKLTLNIGVTQKNMIHFGLDGTIMIYDEGLQPAEGKSSSVGVSPSGYR